MGRVAGNLRAISSADRDFGPVIFGLDHEVDSTEGYRGLPVQFIS